jgi:uncharacterized protein (AIM24 family)
MKKALYIILSAALLASCQKANDNGDLGGFWKLLQIEELKNDTIIDKREESCFWAIQLRMITANRNGGVIGKGRFQHTGDSLFVQMIQKPGNGKVVGLYSPENERFCVNRLTNKSMVLQSDSVILTFRKF